MAERRLGPDKLWADVEQLGPYGPIVDQDIPNLRRPTKGMKASRKIGNTLGRYQESRMRHYLRTLNEYMESD